MKVATYPASRGHAIVVFSIALFVVIMMHALYGIAVFCLLDYWSDRSAFGDMFGAIGALNSGLALAGIVYTMFQQREELRESEKSQRETAQHLSAQASALASVARLDALRVLIDIYEKQYDHASGERRVQISERKKEILEELESFLAGTKYTS